MTEASLGLPDRRWLETALVFNTQPAVWLHDSWCDVLPHGAIVRRLRAVPQAVPQVSGYLLRAFGLERNYCEDFTIHWARLALLDGPALEDLFLHLGLALRRDELQREILGERLRRLQQAVGVERLNSAIKRAPLLGAIPTFTFEPEAVEPRARFTLIGARFCAMRLAILSPPLLRRMTLKLPAAWSACLNAPNPQSKASCGELPPLLRKLLRDLPPAWNPLFV